MQNLMMVATHMLAFAIFFMIMKTAAWPMILKTLDERQKAIQDGFDDIRRMKAEAEASQKAYEERLKGIEHEAREKIAAAVAEGQRVAAEIGEKARADANTTLEAGRKKLEIELAGARKQLREDVINLTLKATEQLLAEKMTDARDRELVGSFVGDLESRS